MDNSWLPTPKKLILLVFHDMVQTAFGTFYLGSLLYGTMTSERVSRRSSQKQQGDYDHIRGFFFQLLVCELMMAASIGFICSV